MLRRLSGSFFGTTIVLAESRHGERVQLAEPNAREGTVRDERDCVPEGWRTGAHCAVRGDFGGGQQPASTFEWPFLSWIYRHRLPTLSLE